MAELADAPDLGSGSKECRFDPCYPHQTEGRSAVGVPLFEAGPKFSEPASRMNAGGVHSLRLRYIKAFLLSHLGASARSVSSPVGRTILKQ